MYHTKFLGVILDNQLNWSEHIKYISNKISKAVGVIIKARKVFDTATLKTLYYSLIYPYLSYCIHIWGAAYGTYTKSLVCLQKKIVRIISGKPPRSASDPLFSELKILKLEEIFKYNIALFMYKFYHGLLPPLFDMFKFTSEIHGRDTRQSSLLYLPLCRTNRRKMTIVYTGTKIWNDIFLNMDIYCAIGTFKKRLKSFIANC